jgi:PAS domain S-box-containing protein
MGGEPSLNWVLDRIHDAVIAYDREWRFVYVNRTAEAHLGRPREALLGAVLWETFPALHGTELARRLRDAAGSDAPSEFEVRGPMQGRIVAIRAHAWEGGLVCCYRDVTAQREAEAALRASEEKYRSVFENSFDGFLLTRTTGEILTANPAACRMLGRTEAEIRDAGRAGVVDLTDPRLGPLLAERARIGRARGEVRMRRKDGTTFAAALSSSVFTASDGSSLTSLSMVDLTESSAALNASLDYESTLQALTRLVVPARADLCAVDLAEGDAVRRVAMVHRPLELDALRARQWCAASGTAERVQRVLRAGAPESAPAGAAHADVMVPMRVGERCVGVLSLVRFDAATGYDAADVSLALRLAAQAALALENARNYGAAVEAKRLRDEMLSIVSHDLRSPLNTISLNASLIGRRCEGERPAIERITRALQQADRLIEDLLVIARLDAGELSLQRARERVASLLEEVLCLHATQAEAKGVSLAIDAAGAVPDVYVDRHRIVRALGNLVTNAVKFTDAGGAVSLAARADAARVTLSVSDTGCGVAADELPRLFDRFWQGTQARRADAGLGLAIVKGIAEAHGGSVSVRSEVGRGTTFEVTLPAHEAFAQAP